MAARAAKAYARTNRFQKTLRSREREDIPILGASEPDGFAFRAVACFRQGAARIGPGAQRGRARLGGTIGHARTIYASQ